MLYCVSIFLQSADIQRKDCCCFVQLIRYPTIYVLPMTESLMLSIFRKWQLSVSTFLYKIKDTLCMYVWDQYSNDQEALLVTSRPQIPEEHWTISAGFDLLHPVRYKGLH